jgi:two-component system cell cycle sensor histidine kinase PleC
VEGTPFKSQDLSAVTADERQTELTLLELGIGNVRVLRLGVPVFIICTAVILSLWVDVAAVAAWTLAQCIVIVGLVLVSRYYLPRRWNVSNLVELRAVTALCAFLAMSVWSAIGVLFWVPGNVPNNLFLASILAISPMAIAVILGPHLLLFTAGFLPLATVIAVFGAQTAAESSGLSVVGIVFVIFAITLAGETNRMARGVLHMADENALLAARLAKEAAKADTARRIAEEQSRANSRFLAEMSHELKTPLNAILGFSEVIRDQALGPVGNARYASYAADIHASGAHLLTLINDVLDFSRIEAGKVELNSARISVSELFEDVLGQFELRAKQTGVAIRAHHIADFPCLWADEKAVRQILASLINQALRGTARGGTIALSARLEPSGALVLAVADTGSEEEDDSPSASGKATRRKEKSPGLGMPIVKGLLELHGGHFAHRRPGAQCHQAEAVFPAERVVPPQASLVH